MNPVLPRVLALLAAPLLVGCEANPEKAKAQPAPPPAPVVTALVDKKGVEQERRFFAETTASSDANLSAAEAGRVTQVLVREGAHVERGQLLILLDDQLAQAQLSEALAQKERTSAAQRQAQLEESRFEAMREEKVVSDLEAARKRAEAETLTAASQGAVAQVAQGTERIRRHRIVAPFSGTVARRNVDPGDWINPGEVALQLLTDEHVEVQVYVPASVLDQLPRLQGVAIESDGKRVAARLEGAVNALDPRTRTALLRLTSEGETPPWLRVGSSAFAVFTFHQSGLTIPRDAIVVGVAADRVMKVVDGLAEPVPIEVVARSTHDAIVSSKDLHVGDSVVIKGNERLRPGQLVTTEGALVPPAAASPAPSKSPASQQRE